MVLRFFAGLLLGAAVSITSSTAETDQWKPITRPTPPIIEEWAGPRSSFGAVLAIPASHVLIAVGERGHIIRSEDGGKTWSDIPTRTEANLRGITALPDRRTLIAVGDFGAVIRSGDEGKTWDTPTRQGDLTLLGVAMIPNTSIIIAVGDRGTVLRGTVRAGQVQWDAPTRLSDQSLGAVLAVPHSDLVVVIGANGTVLHGRVSGDQVKWDPPSHHGDQSLYGIAAVPSANLLVVVGDNGTVLLGSVSGSRIVWGAPTQQTGQFFSAITLLPNSNLLVAVGPNGAVVTGNVSGRDVRWEASTQVDNRYLSGITVVPNANTLVAVGSFGALLRGTVAGRQIRWDTLPQQDLPSLIGIAALPNTKTVVAVGMNGVVLRGKVIQGKVAWDPPTRQGDQTLTSIVAVPNTKLMVAVGANGTVLRGTVAGDLVRWEKPIRISDQDLNHIEAIPNTKMLIAIGSNGTVIRGLVAGDQVQWDKPTRQGDQVLNGLVAVPNTNILVAVGGNGTVLRGTVTGDQVWWDQPARQGDELLYSIVAVPNTNSVVAVGTNGIVLRAALSGGGLRWDTPTRIGDQYLGSIVTMPGTNNLLAVGGLSTVILSDDAGVSWSRQIVHMGENSLWNAAIIDDRVIAVGSNGSISNFGNPAPLPVASEYRFGATQDSLTFAWRYPPGVQAMCTAAYYDILGTREIARPINPAELHPVPMTEGKVGFSVSWSPADHGIGQGTNLRYSIICADPVFPEGVWRQELPAFQQYSLSPGVLQEIRAWIDTRPSWLQSLLAVAGLMALWCALLFILWAVAPRNLVALHEWLPDAKALDQAVEGADRLTAGLSKALRLFGVAALLKLGTSRRALDAWVSAKVPETLDRFTRLKVVQDRRIALDLPVILDGARLDHPWPALDVLLRRPAVSLLITGPGGAGKTTLACQIGRRALGEQGPPIGGAYCLPLLVDRNLEASETGPGFLPCLAGALRAALNIPRLSVKLAETLLRSSRVMVIVDGLSERDEATKRSFDPTQPDFPIMRLIVTTRDPSRGSMSAVIETIAIPPDALYSFIARYIDTMIAAIEAETGRPYAGQRQGEADIHSACAQLTRLLRDKPITPLFAAMWAEELMRNGEMPAARIQSAAELIDSYVERLLAPVAGGNAVQLENLRLDLVAIASREMGETLRPGWLTRANVLAALRARSADNPERRFDILLKSRLLEADSRNSELIRITLDPIAEHLIARSRVEAMAGDPKQWRSFLETLKRHGWPPGLVEAVRACIEARGYGHQARPIPEMVLRELLNSEATFRQKIS